MFRVSPSSLGLLKDCPRCFWLATVKNIKRPEGIFPSLPSGVDRVLKEHFDRFARKGELPPELKKEGVTARPFDDHKLLEVWRANYKGISFTDDQSGITLRGAVDNILENDGKLVVLDFKTRGFALKDDTHHHYQNQLDLYNFLLRKNGFETEDYAYLLFYIPEKINEEGEFLFETKLVKMETSVKHAEELFAKAISVLQGGEPQSSPSCPYCSYCREMNGRN